MAFDPCDPCGCDPYGLMINEDSARVTVGRILCAILEGVNDIVTASGGLVPAQFEPLASVPFGSIGAAYAAVGILTSGAAKQLTFANNTNQDILISFNGGLADHALVQAGSTRTFAFADITTDLAVDPQVKRAGAAPTSGSLTVEIIK